MEIKYNKQEKTIIHTIKRERGCFTVDYLNHTKVGVCRVTRVFSSSLKDSGEGYRMFLIYEDGTYDLRLFSMQEIDRMIEELCERNAKPVKCCIYNHAFAKFLTSRIVGNLIEFDIPEEESLYRREPIIVTDVLPDYQNTLYIKTRRYFDSDDQQSERYNTWEDVKFEADNIFCFPFRIITAGQIYFENLIIAEKKKELTVESKTSKKEKK